MKFTEKLGVESSNYFKALLDLKQHIKKNPIHTGDSSGIVFENNNGDHYCIEERVTAKTREVRIFRTDAPTDKERTVIRHDLDNDKFPYMNLLEWYLDHTVFKMNES